MKRVAISLFLALAFAAGVVAQDAHSLAAKADAAAETYWACLVSVDVRDCSELERAYSAAYEAAHKAWAAQIRANTAALAAEKRAAQTPEQKSDAAYAAYRQNRRWWQVWRRCPLR